MSSAFLKVQFSSLWRIFASPLQFLPSLFCYGMVFVYIMQLVFSKEFHLLLPLQRESLNGLKNSSLLFCHWSWKKPEVLQLEQVLIFLSAKIKICSLMPHVNSDLWFGWKPRYLKNISWKWKANSVGNPENKDRGFGAKCFIIYKGQQIRSVIWGGFKCFL